MIIVKVIFEYASYRKNQGSRLYWKWFVVHERIFFSIFYFIHFLNDESVSIKTMIMMMSLSFSIWKKLTKLYSRAYELSWSFTLQNIILWSLARILYYQERFNKMVRNISLDDFFFHRIIFLPYIIIWTLSSYSFSKNKKKTKKRRWYFFKWKIIWKI